MPRFRRSGFSRLRTNKTREHLGARKTMENGFIFFEVFFWIGGAAKFLPSFAQGIQPRRVFGGVLLLQFFSETLCEGGTFSVCRDGNLQIAALDDGAIVEMAVSNVVDGVAEN